MTTLGTVLARHARRVPEREALVSGETRYSYAQLDAEVNKAAHVLSSSGLATGDRLALLSTNTVGFVVTFYAAMRLGLIVVPVNPRMAAPEVTYLLDDSGARALLFDPALVEVATAAHAAAAEPPALLLATRPLEGHEDLVSRTVDAPTTDPGVTVTAEDDAEILYTAGTTGRPKGGLRDQHRGVGDGVNMNLGL